MNKTDKKLCFIKEKRASRGKQNQMPNNQEITLFLRKKKQ